MITFLTDLSSLTTAHRIFWLIFLLVSMRLSSAVTVLVFTPNTESWSSELVVPHNNVFLNISSAAKEKLSTTHDGAPDQPTTYPSKSKY